MNTKVKGLVFACLALVLTLSLVSLACAPKAPVGEVVPKADLTKAQADLAAEKQKTTTAEKKATDLEAQIAALKKPAEVTKATMACVTPAGTPWDAANWVAEAIEEASGGRFEITVIPGESMAPTEEFLESTRDGLFDLLLTYDAYHSEKVPVTGIFALLQLLMRSPEDYWAVFQYLGLDDIFKEEYTKFGIHHIISWGTFPGDALAAAVPIPDFESLKGLKLRCGGCMGYYLEAAGAGTVWFPGGEIYTSMASGLIDGFTYGSPATQYDMKWYEVTKYWIVPSLDRNATTAVYSNPDFWNALSAADQAMITYICQLGGARQSYQETYQSIIALQKVQEVHGITVLQWSEESQRKWTENCTPVCPKPDADPAGIAAIKIVESYARSKGYID